MKKLIAVVLFTLMMSVAPVWAENGAYEFLDRAVAYYVSKIPYSMPDSVTVYASKAEEELSNIDSTLRRIEKEINFLRKGIQY